MRWIKYGVVALFVALVLSYVLGIFPVLGEAMLLAGLKVRPSLPRDTAQVAAGQSRLIVGQDGGSSLSEYGIKYYFVDNVELEGTYSWGVWRRQVWLVFGYKGQNGGKILIVVPVRGVVGLKSGDASNTELVEPQEVRRLASGKPLNLTFMYRYKATDNNSEVREMLVEKGIGRVSKTRREVEWRLGNFPAEQALTEQELRDIFKGDESVVVIDDGVSRLSTIVVREK